MDKLSSILQQAKNPPLSVVVKKSTKSLILVSYGLSKHKIYTVGEVRLDPDPAFFLKDIGEYVPIQFLISININNN